MCTVFTGLLCCCLVVLVSVHMTIEYSGHGLTEFASVIYISRFAIPKHIYGSECGSKVEWCMNRSFSLLTLGPSVWLNEAVTLMEGQREREWCT